MRRTSRRGPWAAWMRATGRESGPPVSRRCLGQRRTSRSSWSVPLPRGRWEGASGIVAPAGRESEVMSGQAKARRVSSAVLVQKAQARSTSPVDRAARHPVCRGSRRRWTRRSRSCSSRWAGVTGLGRTNLTPRCDSPRRLRSKRTGVCRGTAPRGIRSAAWSSVASRVSTSRLSMREGRVPSGPWYEQKGSLPRADASSRSASTSRWVTRDGRTDGGARSG